MRVYPTKQKKKNPSYQEHAYSVSVTDDDHALPFETTDDLNSGGKNNEQNTDLEDNVSYHSYIEGYDPDEDYIRMHDTSDDDDDYIFNHFPSFGSERTVAFCH